MPNDTTTNHWLLLSLVYMIFPEFSPLFLGTSQDNFLFVFMNMAGLHHNIPVTVVFSPVLAPLKLLLPMKLLTYSFAQSLETLRVSLGSILPSAITYPSPIPWNLGVWSSLVLNLCWLLCRSSQTFREICYFNICKQILWDRSGWPMKYATQPFLSILMCDIFNQMPF